MLRDFRGDLVRALPGSRAIQVWTTHGVRDAWQWWVEVILGSLGSWRKGGMPEGV